MGDDFTHTSCLRGFSYCVSLCTFTRGITACHKTSSLSNSSVCGQGVLFVLLQHQLLSSLEEDEAKSKDLKEGSFLSLIAVNPLSGKSVLATKLYPHNAWSGR